MKPRSSDEERDHVVPNEQIRCKGCGTRAACVFHLLPCRTEHGVSACRDCGEFPCERIQNMLESSLAKREQCRSACENDAEFAMFERAFYEKKRNLEGNHADRDAE